MTITVVASLAGAPGVTTAATALAIHGSRPTLLVEADTHNASSMMPGFLRSNFRPQDGGIEKVIAALTSGVLSRSDIFNPEHALSIPLHNFQDLPDFPIPSLPAGHRVWVVPGFFHLNLAEGARSAWPSLVPVLQSISEGGVDVVIDIGHLDYNDARLHLLDAADYVYFCVEQSMTGLNRAVRRLNRDDLSGRTDTIAREGRYWVLPVRPIAEEVSTKDLEKHTLPTLPPLPHDPLGAATFSHGRPDLKPARNRYRAAARRVTNATLVAQASAMSGGSRSV